MDLQTKYSPKESEDKIYKFWLKGDYCSGQLNPAKKPFCIVIPPPNITGILHMGHALNNTIQDVLIRFQRMIGAQALWMPGTDHAGIATQNVVEKKLAKQGLKKEQIGRSEFIKQLWTWTDEYGSTILQQLNKLGASCDWERTRFTMDENYSEAVKEAFVRLYKKGLIYRGNYIINWCPRCKTALSDEEAPHNEIDGWLYYIRYPIEGVPRPTSHVPRYIVVATTRPETMLGDTAVAIHPNDKRYSWLKEVEITLPVMNRKLVVIKDELIDPEFGTGIVKVTPAHDPVDFQLAKKHNLSFINIMGDDAILNENAGDFAGMDRFEAREALLEVLRKQGLIEKETPYKISAGHCYRCHTIIEPRLSLQWFVKMKPLAEAAIKVVEEDKIKFYPRRWKKVYLNWMHNIQDWCISRQIWWGHQLPVYYCDSCLSKDRNNSPDKNHQSQPSSQRQRGVIVSKTVPKECPDCGSSKLVQDQDVLDTWFSSWLWPFATFYWPFTDYRLQDTSYKPKTINRESENERMQYKAWSLKQKELEYFYPTSVLVTASEILFFWVARMIMAGLEFIGEIPFEDVLIHGTVRDAKGIKMSKSLGNTIDPLDVIDKFGADSLRFSLMLLASTGSDIYLSDDKFLVGRNFANKMWNATRFILSKIKENKISIEDLDISNLDAADIWILNALNATIQKVTDNLKSYRINDATKEIYDFFWHIFCDWYIEIAKFKFDETKAKILILCLFNSIKLLHPVMPFITEEIYQLLKLNIPSIKGESIMTLNWPSKLTLKANKEQLLFAEAMISLVKEIRNLKTDLSIPVTKKIKALLKTDQDTQRKLTPHKQWLVRMGSLEDIEFPTAINRILFANASMELDFALEEFNRDNFISSLDKRIVRLEGLLEKISKKLDNKNFIDNAPPETVENEREKFKVSSNQVKRLRRLKNAFR